MMHRIVFIILPLWLLAACQQAPLTPTPAANTAVATTTTPTPNPTATTAATPSATNMPSAETEPDAAPIVTPLVTMTVPISIDEVEETEAAQPLILDITFAGADDLTLHATYYQPGGLPPFPGVILLHMLGDDRSVWANERTDFGRMLMQSGYAVLAVDMRGHGSTGGSRDWTLAEEDLLQAWATLTAWDEVDDAHTAVIGASIGSNMALRLAAMKPDIKTAVLLSPGLDYRGVTTEDALALYGNRPLLIVASRDDSYAANSSTTLQAQATETAELILYDTAGHGTNMLTAEPELADQIVDWLNAHLK